MDHRRDVALRTGNTASLWLLVSLLISLLVLPLLEGLHVGRAILLVGITSTFVLGAVATRSRLRAAIFVLLVVALPTVWATLFVNWKPLFVAHCLLGSVFFWLVGGVIVFATVRTRAVTFDSVFGAICAYLLFGLAWALSYWAVYAVAPDSLKLPDGGASMGKVAPSQGIEFSQFIYYSFVTMTTLGYGDITPLHRITRTLTWIQSVTGQFYVAVVIAWLVSALPRPGEGTR